MIAGMTDLPRNPDATTEPVLTVSPQAGWERLPPAAVTAARLVAALSMAPLVVPAGVLGQALFGVATAAAIALAVLLIAASLGAWLGSLRARRVRYALLAEGLRIRRGVCWWRETLVPRSRVQHLDLERGPIERRLGLATLVIHTAGTRMNAVRLAGLDAARARVLRDALVDREGEDDAV